jgi:hypothetical protein
MDAQQDSCGYRGLVVLVVCRHGHAPPVHHQHHDTFPAKSLREIQVHTAHGTMGRPPEPSRQSPAADTR